MKKDKFLNLKGIGGQLILILISVSVFCIALTALLSFINARDGMYDMAYDQLNAIRQLKKQNITNFFGEREGDIKFLAQSMLVNSAINAFRDTVQKSGYKSAEFRRVNKRYEAYFKQYTKAYGYYDLFIIDKNGNVIYTVSKESDFATNLVNGKWKDTGLANAYRKAINREYILTDIERYAPSNGAPAMFSAYPITNEQNQTVGVLAFQIPLSKISNLMLESTGLKNTGETYLVGEDFYFRSHSRLMKKAGKKDVTLKEKAESETIKLALSDKKGYLSMRDYRGEMVLSSYDVIDFKNFKWAIMAEIDVAEILAPSYRLLRIIIFASIAVLIAVAFIALFVAKKFTMPIKTAVAISMEIAQKILKTEVPEKYLKKKDEIGELARSLSQMRDNLIQIIEELSDVASNLSASSEEISASAQNLADGAQNQASSVEETSASIEELSSAIAQVADNSNNINQKSENLLSTAQESAEIIDSAEESMTKISTSSEQISEILNVINDISDQTNLLALNAAIEAARAGEHGRGFAVVADEISKLADKSVENAKEIEKLIKQSMVDVKKGTQIVNDAGNSFKTIIQGIEANNTLIDQITRAAEQQRTGSDQVQTAVETINEVTQNTSASAEEMAASTEELQSQAESVKLMIDEFELPQQKKAIQAGSKGKKNNKNDKNVAVYNE